MRRRWTPALGLLVALVVTSCGVAQDSPSARHPDFRTVVVRESALTVADGVTAAIEFIVPEGTEAVSVLATAADREGLVQLASLTFDGDVVFEAAGGDLARMDGRHRDHEAISNSEGFVQEVQRGTFAFTYPFAPGWELPSGPATISFLASAGTRLEVEVLALRPTKRGHLTVSVFSPGARTLSEDARREVEAILDQAGLPVSWEDQTLPTWAPGELSDLPPDGNSYRLLADTVASRSTGTVNLVIVDALPGGVSGLSTGIPGPHDGTGTAITVTLRDPGETARLVAHEIGHLLGLRHLEDRSATGLIVENPITDTRADAYNLMQFGTNLTDGQIEVVHLSPLLRDPDAGAGEPTATR